MTSSGVEYRVNPRFVPDNVSIKFGTGGDARLYYDGSDLVVSPADVGAGDLKVSGASLLLDSGEKIDFGAGDVMLTHASSQLQIDGGDLIVTDGDGLVIGHTAQITTFAAQEFQILGTANADAGMALIRYSADATGPDLILGKSRGALGANALVSDDDNVGSIWFYASDDTGAEMNQRVAGIRAFVDGSPGAGDTPGRLIFETTADGAGSSTERMRINSAGGVFIGETANLQQTVGLTINQGANDNNIFTLKSSDINHGMTAIDETDTYGAFKKHNGTRGGLEIGGYKATGEAGRAIQLFARLVDPADTTKTTAALGVFQVGSQIKSGTTVTGVGADGNMVVFASSTTARFIFDAEGSAHADVEWTTYDAHDDLALIADIENELLLREDAAQTGRRHMLEATGIIGKDSWHFENGKPRAMVNTTRLAMLHHGALIQVANRFNEFEARIAGLEQRLLAAGA